MRLHKFLVALTLSLMLLTNSVCISSADVQLNDTIYENFEGFALTSYQGGNNLQASVKANSGGSQNVVSVGSNKLKISVEYLEKATSHDSFVQMSTPMSVSDCFGTSVLVSVPDSSNGIFTLYAICGEYIPVAKIGDNKITYPGGKTDEYTDGEEIKVSFKLEPAKNRLRVYKDDVLRFGTDDIKSFYPNCDLSSVRVRFSANVFSGNSNKFDVYIDEILVSGRNSYIHSIGNEIYISQNFEGYTPASYAGGEGILAAVKPNTGGSQNIVQKENKKLELSVRYIEGASAHDTFVQMSEPMVVSGKFISTFDVCIPDSSKGMFNVEMMCGESIFPLSILNGKINYPGNISQNYTDGETVTFSIIVDSIKNKLWICKNNIVAFVSENTKNDFPNCDFSSVRLRLSAVAIASDTNKYSMFTDNIYIAGGVSEDKLYMCPSEVKKMTDGNFTDVSYVSGGTFSFEKPIGFSGLETKKVTFILIHYSNDLLKQVKDVKLSKIKIYPGFQNVKINFEIDKFISSDSYEIYFIPEGDYSMSFNKIAELPFTKFTNPAGEKIVDAISSMHPRIWLNNDKIESLKQLIKSDENVKAWYQKIKSDAQSLLSEPLPVYEDDDPQRLACSQKVVASVPLLSLVYLLENDESYAFRAYEYMMAVSDFEDWAPYHFLDTSNVTTAVAIGYDWLYHYFKTKKIDVSYFEDKIASMGLNMGRDAYLKKLYTGNYWWVDASTNWNVCCNSGMIVGALSIGDVGKYASLSAFILESGLSSLEKMLPRFAPDGAWFEGPSYWHSTTMPLCSLVDALETAVGTDYGIMNYEGLSNTAYYPIMNTGKSITFNLHDASESAVSAPQFWYLAKKFNDKNIAGYRCWQITQKSFEPTYRDILWYDASLVEEDFDKNIKKDGYFRDTEVAVFRNTYKGDNVNFFGIHGGSNSVEHGQLDAGSFVYEALGERWAIDLGGEAYNMHNYWIMDDIEKSRWSYYRSRAEGHNTVVINPGLYADQNIKSMSEIKELSFSDTVCKAKVDFGGAYKAFSSLAVRGIEFDKSSGNLRVYDKIKLNAPYDVYWFMHTKADIMISEDKKSAVLTQNGKSILVSCNGVGEFGVMDAVPLASSPNPDEWPENMANNGSLRAPTHQNENKGVKKLMIFLEKASGEVNFDVTMTPDTIN